MAAALGVLQPKKLPREALLSRRRPGLGERRLFNASAKGRHARREAQQQRRAGDGCEGRTCVLPIAWHLMRGQ